MRPHVPVRHCIFEVCPCDLGRQISNLVGIISDGPSDGNRLLSFAEPITSIPNVSQTALGICHRCRQVEIQKYRHDQCQNPIDNEQPSIAGT